MAKKTINVLEITETHIKLIQAREESSGNVITKFLIENISSPREETIIQQLGNLVKKHNLKLANLITVIPRNLVIIRNVNFPSHNHAEIAKMAELQAIRQIPYSRQDLVTNHSVVQKDPAGYSRALVTIIHKDVINRFLKIVSTVAVSELFALSSQGTVNWYKTYQAKTKRIEQGVTVIVNIDTITSDICFFYDGHLIFSRSLGWGLRDFSNKDSEDLVRQIRLTFATYKKEKIGPDISNIVLTPSCENTKHLAGRLREEFSVPIEIVDPQVGVDLERGLSVPSQITKCELSGSVVLGFATAKKEELIDLLPAQEHKERAMHAKKKEVAVLGVLIALAAISFFSAIYVKVHKKEQHLKSIQVRLAQIDPEAENISQMSKKLKLIKERVNPKVSSVDIIYELYNILPANMSLSIFEQDEQDNLVLQGIALAMGDVFNFRGRLDKSSYFSNVEVRHTRSRKTRKGEMTDFTIVCKIAR